MRNLNLLAIDSRVQLQAEHAGVNTFLNVHVLADDEDTATPPKLIITLPRHTQVTHVVLTNQEEVSVTNHFMDLKKIISINKSKDTNNYIQIDLPNLSKEDFNARITIQSNQGASNNTARAAAFIYGITPKTNREVSSEIKKNNFSKLAGSR